MTRIMRGMNSAVTDHKKDLKDKGQDLKSKDQDLKSKDPDLKSKDQDQERKDQDQERKDLEKDLRKKKPKRWLSQEALPARHHDGKNKRTLLITINSNPFL